MADHADNSSHNEVEGSMTPMFWMAEIARSTRVEKSWRLRGREIVRLFRNAKQDNATVTQSFNILFSNTQTIKPAVYSATPKPDVRRRWKDDNPTGKEVAELMERALSFSVDAYDFDSAIEMAVDDQLLPGRGTVRVRYIPTIEETTEETEEPGLDENGDDVINAVEETFDKIADQEVVCEYVYWEDFRMGPARNWGDDIPWVAFRHKFTKSQFEDEFGTTHTSSVSFSASVEDIEEEGKSSRRNKSGSDRLGIVWEVWDRNSRKVLWITKGVNEFLDVDEDPLNLRDFFPVPAPLYAVETTNTMTPVPLYEIYRELAEELNLVQTRILKLTNGLKLRGVYPNNMEEIAGLLNMADNQMIGIKDFSSFEGKKLQDFILFAPLDDIIKAIVALTNQRESIKQVIFEVTGISDILRGQTKPNETLGAQRIKANFGTARLENLQKNVRVLARDLFRMKAEIIADKFTPEILQLMTGIEVTPEMEQMLRSDVLRNFNIDIETDSTVAIDKEGEANKALALLSGIAEFTNGIGPAVASGIITVDIAKDLLLFGIRSAGGGRQVEDAINRIGEEQEQQPGVPGQQGLPQGVVPIAGQI